MGECRLGQYASPTTTASGTTSRYPCIPAPRRSTGRSVSLYGLGIATPSKRPNASTTNATAVPTTYATGTINGLPTTRPTAVPTTTGTSPTQLEQRCTATGPTTGPDTSDLTTNNLYGSRYVCQPTANTAGPNTTASQWHRSQSRRVNDGKRRVCLATVQSCPFTTSPHSASECKSTTYTLYAPGNAWIPFSVAPATVQPHS